MHEPIGLITRGEDKTCGETGQRYLVWSPSAETIGCKFWAHLAENAKMALVLGCAGVISGETIESDCVSLGRQTPTVKVQEAWRNKFRSASR
jgi:hypothetical protein